MLRYAGAKTRLPSLLCWHILTREVGALDAHGYFILIQQAHVNSCLRPIIAGCVPSVATLKQGGGRSGGATRDQRRSKQRQQAGRSSAVSQGSIPNMRHVGCRHQLSGYYYAAGSIAVESGSWSRLKAGKRDIFFWHEETAAPRWVGRRFFWRVGRVSVRPSQRSHMAAPIAATIVTMAPKRLTRGWLRSSMCGR